MEGLLDIEGSLVVRCGVKFFRDPMDDGETGNEHVMAICSTDFEGLIWIE